MDFLRKLFCRDVKVRFEGVTEDGTAFSGTTTAETGRPLVGEELRRAEVKLASEIFARTGERVRSLTITGVA